MFVAGVPCTIGAAGPNILPIAELVHRCYLSRGGAFTCVAGVSWRSSLRAWHMAVQAVRLCADMSDDEVTEERESTEADLAELFSFFGKVRRSIRRCVSRAFAASPLALPTFRCIAPRSAALLRPRRSARATQGLIAPLTAATPALGFKPDPIDRTTKSDSAERGGMLCLRTIAGRIDQDNTLHRACGSGAAARRNGRAVRLCARPFCEGADRSADSERMRFG